MIIFLSLWIAFIFLIHISLLIQSFQKAQKNIIKEENLPFVSVLLAVRNEEKVILRCLEALKNLDYPKNKIEILIGNDNSSDNTKKIIQNFIQEISHFHLFTITNQVKNLKGKSNILAQLAQKARGKYFFLTDADTEVSPLWIRHFLYFLKAETGLGSGITFLKSKNLFRKLQNIEWLQTQLQVRLVHQFGFALTAWGNNMFIKKEAYEKIGGYEKLGFSVAEDFQLSQNIQAENYPLQYVFTKETKNISLPVDNLQEWQRQRFRWWQGAKQVTWQWKFLVFFYNIGYLFLCWDWRLLIFFFSGNFILQSLLYWRFFKEIEEKFEALTIFIYLFYYPFTQILFLITILSHKKTHWKSRVYD